MNLRHIAIVGATLCMAPAVTAQISPADSLSVAVGTVLGDYIGGSLQRMRSLGLTVDPDVFIRTMDTMLRGSSTGFTVEQANAWIDNYIAKTRPNDLPDKFTIESQQSYLDSVASLPGAVRYPDGLILFVDLEGEGTMPTDNDIVRLMYTGRFYEGTEFDATTSPIEFAVSELAPGFSEGLKLMRPGGRYRLVIPSELAYGPDGIPGAVPGNAVLDFNIDLLGIKPKN